MSDNPHTKTKRSVSSEKHEKKPKKGEKVERAIR